MKRRNQPAASPLSRRDLLRVGGLCGLGMSLAEVWEAQARGAQHSFGNGFGAAKRIIMLYLHGGHPQQETFDPKPDGPSDVRGEFGAVATPVPGVHFSELLPETAKRMNRLAIIRSMTHDNPNHVQASLPAQTGHRHPPANMKKGDFPPSETDFPPIGAVLDHLATTEDKADRPPRWVRVGPLMRRSNGTVLHGQLPGLLGARHSSFVVDQSLLAKRPEIEALKPGADLSTIRLRQRRRLQQGFNQAADGLARMAAARDLNHHYQRACDLLTSAQTRRAFQLSEESSATRDRYGRTEFGQRCLLARRLAESGVAMVNVSYCHTPSGSWDTHSQNFKKMKQSLAPTFDTAFSALLDDLDDRGMLHDTLLIANAEFGRTPAINRSAGRDHWPNVYSLALAGAGLQQGVVHGASDRSAAEPSRDPHDPADLAATLYHLLGVPADTRIRDRFGRPHELIVGQPIQGILV